MITVRKSQDRGYVNHGWLQGYHAFSFAEYVDPAHMGYSVLRVINEDKIAPGTGFGMHSHHDMEIVTYVLAGELRHQDSLGHRTVMRAGDVQRMTAGAGIRHSEVNATPDSIVHLLQIWILPSKQGLPPSYEDRHFSLEQKHHRWCLIASTDGREGATTIHQDAEIYASVLDAGFTMRRMLEMTRCAYLQLIAGEVVCNGVAIQSGDALKIEHESEVEIKALADAELLWFDLPMRP